MMDLSDEVFKGLIGLLISVGLVTLGFYFFFKRRRVVSNGVTVTATLMEWKPSGGHGNSVRTYYPVVGYHTTDQEWVVKEYGISRSNQNVKVGGDIEIIYNIRSPEEFIIDYTLTMLCGPILVVLGIAGMVGSIIYIILKY